MKETSAVKKYKKYRSNKHLYSPKLYNEICFLHESVISYHTQYKFKLSQVYCEYVLDMKKVVASTFNTTKHNVSICNYL